MLLSDMERIISRGRGRRLVRGNPVLKKSDFTITLTEQNERKKSKELGDSRLHHREQSKINHQPSIHHLLVLLELEGEQAVFST